ncbi:hypothetical protein N7471_010437 [Penicillium samsonianum]|uniref:uncharacterized protein n=1 Tax=Penicillium samsonianum TaxID=1882272 RepID=UPI0025479DB0|nr:uncharacterized protein N7471_010437 [Penicillium samsonianum]KAJ6125944.1 hypothetical protein N7471_010437 [Penicillium samsonianum]
MNGTSIRYFPNIATTPTDGRERLVWMDTDESASLEDRRMPHSPPGNFGKELGEPEGILPGTMPSTTRGDCRGQRHSSEKP